MICTESSAIPPTLTLTENKIYLAIANTHRQGFSAVAAKINRSNKSQQTASLSRLCEIYINMVDDA